MARASRPNKKLPAFDPSELNDLIFSPVVGRGVGSHLLETLEPAPAPIPSSVPITDFPGFKEAQYMPTVGTPDVSTVDISDASTADIGDVSTVDDSQSATVAKSSIPSQVEFTPSLPSPSEEISQVQNIEGVSAVPEPTRLDVSTVDRSTLTHQSSREQYEDAAPPNLTTVDRQQSTSIESQSLLDLPTVDRNDGPFNGTFLPRPETWPSESRSSEASEGRNQATVAGAVTKQDLDLSTVDSPDRSTVGGSAPAVFHGTRALKIWVTEQGELVPQGRVKRIGPAQDVLNSAEESVYDTLWAAKSAPLSGDEHSRTVQAGYHYLAKKTRLSKKTIQRIIDKLVQKGFIEIERQADIYARTSTVYRVFSYSAVKERQRRRNRFYVAKIGPGFTYVYEHAPEHLPTVDRSRETTVDSTALTTGDRPATVTVVPRNLSTVVRPTTTEVGRNVLDKTPLSGIHEALNEYGAADDDAVHRLAQRCRQIAADCTEEEIVHFIHQKGALIRGKGSEIYSPIGFLVTAVPKCFSGESFRMYREEQRRRRDAAEAAERQRQRELEEWRREQEERLADPSVPEEDKQLIRECLGLC